MAQSNNIAREKLFALVRYHDDGIRHVCPYKFVINRSNRTLAKYTDGRFYPATILLVNENKKMLENFKNEYRTPTNGRRKRNPFTPRIVLERCKLSNLKRSRRNLFPKVTPERDHDVECDNSRSSPSTEQFDAENSVLSGSSMSSNEEINYDNSDINFHEELDHMTPEKDSCGKRGNSKSPSNKIVAENIDVEFDEDPGYGAPDIDVNSDEDPDYVIESEDSRSSLSEESNNEGNKALDEPKSSQPNTSPETEVYETSFANPKYVSESKGQPKRYFCPFCQEKVLKFARHLQRKHKYEEKVQAFMLLPASNKKRQEIINHLRKEGMFMYNTDIRFNNGDVIVMRRPQQIKGRNAKYYLPCTMCKGFYSKKSLSVHYKICSNKISAPRSLQGQSRSMLEGNVNENSYFKRFILSKLRNDEAGLLAKSDSLIKQFGLRLSIKHCRQQHMHDSIRQRCRQLASLLLTIKQKDATVKHLIDVITPNKFDLIVESIHIVAGLNEGNYTYKIPSLATSLGQSITLCAQITVGNAIKTRDDQLKKSAEAYLQIHELEFSTAVSHIARSTMTENKWNKPKLLPVIEDIKKLNEYLSKECKIAHEKLCLGFDFKAWKQLCTSTMLQIMLFNRKRPGETERLLIEDYNKKHFICDTSDIFQSLNPVEKILSRRYCRIEIRGKWGRGVPILLSQKQIQYIDKIIAFRNMAGVPSSNSFVFGFGETYFRACNILRKAAELCGAKNPENLRGTKLRKHIATVTQIMSLSEEDVRLLADYMGHHVDIHKTFYRLPEETVHLAKMSKLLLAFEKGDIKNFTGHSLDTLDVDLDIEEGPVEIEVSDSAVPECNPEEGTANSQDNLEESSVPDVVLRKKIKRIHWTTPEKRMVIAEFSDNIKNSNLPSKKQCEEMLLKYPILKHRTVAQLKSFIDNVNRKKIKGLVGLVRKSS